MLQSFYFVISVVKADCLFAIPIKVGIGWPLSGLRFVQLEKRQEVTNDNDQIK
jgi:hypothetical protein